MIRIMLRTALACSLLTVTACEVTETTRMGGHVVVRNINEDNEGLDMNEEKLMDAIEENPNSIRNWWRLGDYYERGRKYRRAIKSYEQVQFLTEKEEVKRGQKFVGALYLLARCHTLVNDQQVAVAYLKRILELQPTDMKNAMGVPDFAESHYLLGAIYYENKMFAEADKHLIAFRELRPGDRRADTMLIGIEDNLRPESRSWYGKADDAPARAAAKINTTKKGSVRVEDPTEAQTSEKAPAAEKAPAEAPQKE